MAMNRVMIELSDEQGRRLREVAEAERRPAEELCREAVERYLGAQEVSGRYDAFRRMIGLVLGGPDGASVRHDARPGDEP